MKTTLLSFVAIAGIAIAQSAGAFTAGSNMTTARSQHTATMLADSTVLIAGGYNSSGPVSNAEVYDSVTDAFTPTGAMLNDSVNTATLLADGRVLLVGTHAQLYDPSTRTFTATGIGTAIHGCAGTLLGNGKVLFTDDPPPYGPSANAELYDPDTGAFVPTGPYASIDIARLDHGIAPSYGGWDCRRAILLADGRVLVAGGVAAEIYDPHTDTFSLTGTMAQYPGGIRTTLPPWGDPSRATLLFNGIVLFSGGDGDLGPSTEAWLYNPLTGTFITTGRMSTPRSENTTTLLPDGTVLAAGSYEPGGYVFPNPEAIGTTEFYNPATETFVRAAEMSTSRFGHTATLLADGKVLIAGGTTGYYAPPNKGYTYLSTTELYTPGVVIPAPALFSFSGDGRGQGAIWHAATGLIAWPGNPAVAGEILSMYTTSLADGGVIPPQVVIGGHLAEILFFGAAPGYLGYYQVNFRVPSGVAPGPAIPVHLTYLGRPSNEVTIAVQ
jgi:hypothetical protein